MDECIFCKIVKGEIPCEKIWENDEFLAILDVFPNTKGMTLLLSKKHLDSDIFSLSKEDYNSTLESVRKVVKILEKGLKVKRVAIVVEGMGINHLHVKLYPLYGLKGKFEEMWAKQEIYFEKYEGYITTQLGPKKDAEELKRIAEKIKKNS